MKTVFFLILKAFFHIYYFVLAQVAYFQNKIALQCEMFSVFIYNKSLCFFVLLNIVGKKSFFACVKNKETDWITSKQNELSQNDKYECRTPSNIGANVQDPETKRYVCEMKKICFILYTNSFWVIH